MKKQMLSLLCVLVLALSAAPAVSAADEALRAADTLYTLGIVQGTGSGYDLDAPATRAQAIAVLLRLSGDTAQSGGASPFTDLPAWAASSVNYAYARGLVAGTSPTTFSPNLSVTGNAYCTFLLRLLGYSDTGGDFTVSAAAQFARHIGLTTLSYGSAALTRGDLFRLTADALSFPYKNTDESVAERLLSRGAVSRATANALGLLDAALTARQVYDRCSAATFQLNCYDEKTPLTAEFPSSYASGFFISADGLAVTCYHAITDVVAASVTLQTGETYPVERVVYFNRDIDFAILRVNRRSTDNVQTSAFAHLDVVGNAEIHAGDPVYALGNPLGLGLSITSGIISDASRQVDRYALPCILSTADISQGSSGGALLNTRGQVIGLTSGAYQFGNSMYLAVPANPALTADLTVPGQSLSQVAAQQAEYERTHPTA